MKIGDRVRKAKGYRWPGEVRSVFANKAGEARVVVECTAWAVAGALHIFSPEQLEIVRKSSRQHSVKTTPLDTSAKRAHKTARKVKR